MAKFFALVCFLLVCTPFLLADNTDQWIKKAVAAVNEDNIRDSIQTILGPTCPDMPGYDDRLKATRQYLAQALSGYPSMQLYVPSEEDQFKNTFIIKNGTNPNNPPFVIGAHIRPLCFPPSRALGQAPNDDDAGVAAVIEAVRVLADIPLSTTIIFIVFDDTCGIKFPPAGMYWLREFGIPHNVSVLFNMDGIGAYNNTPGSAGLPSFFEKAFPDVYKKIAADGFRGNFINSFTDSTSAPYAELFQALAQKYVPELIFYPLIAPMPGAQVCESALVGLCLSQQGNFWSNQLPALQITDGARLYTTVDPHFAANVLRAVLAIAIFNSEQNQ